MANPTYPEVTLPDGTTIYCLNKFEARTIYGHMTEYFRHGIEIKRGDTVLDVGANIGMFTLAAYYRCHGEVNVFALEPIPRIFNALRLNLERIDATRLKALPYGAATQCTTMDFSYFPKVTAWSSAHRNSMTARQDRLRMKRTFLAGISGGLLPSPLRFLPGPLRSAVIDIALRRMLKSATVTCEVRTLSAVIDENNIRSVDLLKVDVESSELDVLMSIEPKHWDRIRQIVMEVENVTKWAQTIVSLLTTHGFHPVTLDQNAEQLAGDFGMIYATR